MEALEELSMASKEASHEASAANSSPKHRKISLLEVWELEKQVFDIKTTLLKRVLNFEKYIWDMFVFLV